MNVQQVRREVDRATKACWLALPAPNAHMTPTELRAALVAFSAALTTLRAMAYELRDLDLLTQVHTFSSEANLMFSALAQNTKTGLLTI